MHSHPLSSGSMRTPSALGLLAVAIVLAACGATAPPAPTQGPPASGYSGWPIGPDPNASMVPLIVSSELVSGPNRFLFSLTDAKNALIAGPDLAARVVFDVRDTGTTPALGSKAPSSDTLTAGTPEEIAAISTDDDPDPDFYRVSVADALAAGRPLVLVFATPLFCSSRTCGPTLDNVKGIAAPYKDRIDFIHVEPYKLEQVSGGLQLYVDASGGFQVVPAVAEWGLPTEPWVFVVAADGTLAAKFEGAVGVDELREVLNALVDG